MRIVLVIGAGKSASYLIDYLLKKAAAQQLHIIIGDLNTKHIDTLLKGHPHSEALQLDISNGNDREAAIKRADVVISMLPPSLHIQVAKDCVTHKKHLVTASYVSPEMQELDDDVKKNGLVFMNEIGLDPGVDHMSAMQVIDRIRSKGGKMLLFESFTGGLVAPENDTNLWNYKFTWNPRNVVLAGQSGSAKFIQEGTYKYIPYYKLFRRTEFIDIEGYGKFEVYPNRDSLNYRSAYGLDDILTLYRGTIRRVGFSRAWNMFVRLGITEDNYIIEDSEHMSYRDFINAFLPHSPTDSVELKMRYYLKIDQDDVMWDKLVELDLFSKTKKVGLKRATPAQILQRILEDGWALDDNDKDMIIMYHKFGYELDGKKQQIDSYMVVLGQDRTYTAMAKTVGLPAAMAALHILNGNVTTPGVQIPIHKEIYDPVLEELQAYDVIFKEKEVPYVGYNPDNVVI